MTPKQKAIELVQMFEQSNRGKMSDYSKIYTPTAKQCALISIEQTKKYLKHWSYSKIGKLQMKELLEIERQIKEL